MVRTARPVKLITNFVVVTPPVSVLRPPHDFVLPGQPERFLDNAPPQFHQRCIQIVQVESARRAPRRSRQRDCPRAGKRLDQGVDVLGKVGKNLRSQMPLAALIGNWVRDSHRACVPI